MKYRPYWQRILFLAAVFNLVLFLGGASIFSAPKLQQTSQEDLIEVEWIETAETVSLEPAPENSAAETFSEIILPPLEIQHTIFEPLPKFEVEPIKPAPVQPQPVEKPAETEKPPVEKTEEKTEKPEDKLKAIAKVYPKDIIPQLVQSGVVRGNLTLAEDKIVLAVTITVEGKVRNVEIISGGDKGLIDIVAKTAAGSWRFEPYLDADGNPQELKTQIEFTPEDFQM